MQEGMHNQKNIWLWYLTKLLWEYLVLVASSLMYIKLICIISKDWRLRGSGFLKLMLFTSSHLLKIQYSIYLMTLMKKKLMFKKSLYNMVVFIYVSLRESTTILCWRLLQKNILHQEFWVLMRSILISFSLMITFSISQERIYYLFLNWLMKAKDLSFQQLRNCWMNSVIDCSQYVLFLWSILLSNIRVALL
jgi:hypothetical protein